MSKEKIAMNKTRIKNMMADYKRRMARLMKIKDDKTFLETVNKNHIFLDKINNLVKKTMYLEQDKPSNGYGDPMDGYHVIE